MHNLTKIDYRTIKLTAKVSEYKQVIKDQLTKAGIQPEFKLTNTENVTRKDNWFNPVKNRLGDFNYGDEMICKIYKCAKSKVFTKAYYLRYYTGDVDGVETYAEYPIEINLFIEDKRYVYTIEYPTGFHKTVNH